MASSRKSAKNRSPKSRRAAPREESGGVMLRMFLALVVLGGLAVASATIRIGDTTVLAHMRSIIGGDPAKKAAEPGPSATKAVARELERPPAKKDAQKPAQAAPVASRGDNPPAEVIDDDDRAALEKLLPR